MPSNLVLNADLSVAPALRTWIGNNRELLKGFELRIASDVLSKLNSNGELGQLNVTPSRAIVEGGDIELASTILDGDVSGLIHFPAPSGDRAGDVLTAPLLRAALLSNLPIALNPASASALVRGIKGTRRGYLIFNPISGQGDPVNELAEIRSHLEPQIMLQVWMTKPELDPGEQALQLIEEIQAFDRDGGGESILIASGGDGTVGAVASALQGTGIPLGIIPRGTANAFSVALGIPTGLKAACTNLLLGNTRQVDVALCNDTPMILLAGLGFEAGMVNKASRELKNVLGPMAYIFSGARQLMDQKPFDAHVVVDGEAMNVHASAITVANAAPATSVMAQGFGQVIPDDGQLEVIIASPRGRMGGLSMLSNLARSAMLKNSANSADILCLRTPQLSIKLPISQTMVVDGEITETNHLEVSVIKGALTVVAPIRLSS